jgi:hypothetical protein
MILNDRIWRGESGRVSYRRWTHEHDGKHHPPHAYVYETRRIAGNIDAIETFSGLLDDIDFGTATAKLGPHKASHLMLNGVEISVRPEVTLHSKSKSGEDLVGGIKLHFPKTEPMDEEQANLVSALMNAFCKDHLWKDGSPLPAHCMVIDLASGKVYPSVKSIKQSRKRLRPN